MSLGSKAVSRRCVFFFFFSSRRRHTRLQGDWSSDVCSSDLDAWVAAAAEPWRFLFVVFPGPDGLSHLLDPCHALVLDAYRRIDRALGQFVARARTAGEVPALFVAADHGVSVVGQQDRKSTRLNSSHLVISYA